MANRTDATGVKEILETALTDPEITAHITIANGFVNSRLLNKGLSTDTLTDIERYVTAHLIAVGKERQAMQEKIDTASVTYQGTFGEYLKMTTYGQMALMLDTTGELTKVGKKKASIKTIKQVDNDFDPNY